MSRRPTEELFDASPKKEPRRPFFNRGEWLAIAVLVNTVLFFVWLLVGSTLPLYLVGAVVAAMVWGFRRA
jgi:hypothetical protein